MSLHLDAGTQPSSSRLPTENKVKATAPRCVPYYWPHSQNLSSTLTQSRIDRKSEPAMISEPARGPSSPLPYRSTPLHALQTSTHKMRENETALYIEDTIRIKNEEEKEEVVEVEEFIDDPWIRHLRYEYAVYLTQQGYGAGSGWLSQSQFRKALEGQGRFETGEQAVMRYESDKWRSKKDVIDWDPRHERSWSEQVEENDRGEKSFKESLLDYINWLYSRLKIVECKEVDHLRKILATGDCDRRDLIIVGERIMKEFARLEKELGRVPKMIKATIQQTLDSPRLGRGESELKRVLMIAEQEHRAILRKNTELGHLLIQEGKH